VERSGDGGISGRKRAAPVEAVEEGGTTKRLKHGPGDAAADAAPAAASCAVGEQPGLAAALKVGAPAAGFYVAKCQGLEAAI
jgi:hypothetical protein